jgi:hypothetical protein
MRWRALVLLIFCAHFPAQAAGPARSLAPGMILRGAFVQERHLKRFNAPLRSEGHFVLVSGRGLIWQVEQPFAITTIITAKGLVQQVDGNETMRLDSAGLPFLSRLYDMLGGALGGDWGALQKDFVVERSGDEAHWQVQLAPKQHGDGLSTPFSSIAAQGGAFVDKIMLVKPDGDEDELDFADQAVSNKTLSASENAVFDRAMK